MTSLSAPLALARGPAMKNRFMLAPLTNLQSNDDGTLSDEEYAWLVKRAEGGFALTMTCAAHVQPSGKGFPGQLGIWSDAHLPGLARLAKGINAAGSLSSVQLQHSGGRGKPELIGERLRAPYADAKVDSRALTTGEIEQLVEDFVLAGLRAEQAGFRGVELHGAHGYMLCQFFNPLNLRDDRYGGSFENRTRMFFEIIDGLRARAGQDFQLGVRLSPERWGIDLAEARALATRVMTCGKVDYLDMSLWDVFKEPFDAAAVGTELIDHFVDLPRGECRLGVAGKLMDAPRAQACLDRGADYVLIGRAAILHHDFPNRAIADPDFASIALPASRDHLRAEAVSPRFMDYLATTWSDFVDA